MKKTIYKLWRFFMNIAHNIFKLLAKLINRDLTDSTWDVVEQFLKFSCVGCLNALITLFVYYIIILINKNLYLLGNLLGYIAGILNSYFCNRQFVFKGVNHHNKQIFLRMLVCYGITYFLQLVMLYLFVEQLLISKTFAPILTIIIITPINFILNKIWAFKN